MYHDYTPESSSRPNLSYYLGYQIQVFHFNYKYNINSIKIENFVNICIFSQDSRYLICGDENGYLFFFYAFSNSDESFKNEIRSEAIQYISPIDNN